MPSRLRDNRLTAVSKDAVVDSTDGLVIVDAVIRCVERMNALGRDDDRLVVEEPTKFRHRIAAYRALKRHGIASENSRSNVFGQIRSNEGRS